MATANPARYLAFTDLPFVEQLFLWTVRQLVFCEEMEKPLPTALVRTFPVVGFPQGIPLIWRMLRQLSAAALRPMMVHVPSAAHLMDDERRMIECLRASRHPAEGCPHQALNLLVRADRVGQVLEEFTAVAGQLTAVQVLHGTNRSRGQSVRTVSFRSAEPDRVRLSS